jgi:hypothetical protein
MSALADVFAAVRLTLDGTGFEAQATALASKSGKNVGDTLSKNLSDSLKTAALGAIGATIGAGFGIAITQGAALNDAMSELKRSTGMVGDEAARAQTSLEGMYSRNIQGFAEIGAVMATVRTGLGLTGDAADAMTQKILTYAVATKQDASVAASDFDKILKAFNVTADQVPALMDKLVASHEKYNTVVTDSQAALVAMAPAMVAANMSVDDGVALLNMFAEAGVSAAKAPLALAKAVKLLQPGENIQQLIDQISAIPDPTLRAQKAMEIFGGSGVKWAEVFKTAGVTLSDFNTTSAENTNAMTDAAAAAQTWGDKAVIAFHAVAAPLAEIGNAMGPVMSVARLLPASMTTAITTGMGALAPQLLAKIKAAIFGTIPASIVAGTAEGVATGEAMVGAEAATVAAGGPEVAAGLAAQTGEVVVAGGLMGGSLGTAIGAAAALALPIALGAAVGVVLGEVASNLLGLPSVFTEGKVKRDGSWVDPIASQVSHDQPSNDYSGMGTDELQTSLDKQTALWQSHSADVKWYSSPEGQGIQANIQKTQQLLVAQKAAIPNPFADMATQTAVGLDSTERLVRIGLGHMEQDAAGAWQFIGGVVAPAMTTWNGAVHLGLSEVVASFRQAQSDMESAWGGALDDQTRHQQIADEEIINLSQQRDRQLLQDLKSTDAAVRAAADEKLLNLKTAYMKLLVEDTQYGTDAQKVAKLTGLLQSSELKAGLSDSNPDIAQMWADVKQKTEDDLDIITLNVEAKAKLWGEDIHTALTDAQLIDQIKKDVAAWGVILAPLGAGWSYDPSGGHPVYNIPAPTSSPYVPPATKAPATSLAAMSPTAMFMTTGHYAAGTNYNETAGFYTVGERGTETMYVPQGAAIIPHDQLGGGVTQIFNFPHYVGSRSELTKAIAQELRLVGG